MTEVAPEISANSLAFQALSDEWSDEQMSRRNECSFNGVTRAHGSFAFSANPADGSKITIQGTDVDFVTTPATGKVTIGSDLPTTLANLLAFLRTSTDSNLSLMTYLLDTLNSKLLVTAVGLYDVGNAYTIVAGSSPASHATASGATLTHGAVVAKPWNVVLADELKAVEDRLNPT